MEGRTVIEPCPHTLHFLGFHTGLGYVIPCHTAIQQHCSPGLRLGPKQRLYKICSLGSPFFFFFAPKEKLRGSVPAAGRSTAEHCHLQEAHGCRTAPLQPGVRGQEGTRGLLAARRVHPAWCTERLCRRACSTLTHLTLSPCPSCVCWRRSLLPPQQKAASSTARRSSGVAPPADTQTPTFPGTGHAHTAFPTPRCKQADKPPTHPCRASQTSFPSSR